MMERHSLWLLNLSKFSDVGGRAIIFSLIVIFFQGAGCDRKNDISSKQPPTEGQTLASQNHQTDDIDLILQKGMTFEEAKKKLKAENIGEFGSVHNWYYIVKSDIFPGKLVLLKVQKDHVKNQDLLASWKLVHEKQIAEEKTGDDKRMHSGDAPASRETEKR